ncbi:MAG TPA: hypothetical protein VGA88_14530 [Burkholderiales bacterium]
MTPDTLYLLSLAIVGGVAGWIANPPRIVARRLRTWIGDRLVDVRWFRAVQVWLNERATRLDLAAAIAHEHERDNSIAAAHALRERAQLATFRAAIWRKPNGKP